MEKVFGLIDKLEKSHSLELYEYEELIKGFSPEAAKYAAEKAVKLRQSVYSKDVYIRGLIEVSNFCKNDCLYCGIRNSNKLCDRYRLSKEEILLCCKEGYNLGFRTFVLQGGEDAYFTDDYLCEIIKEIKAAHPDCAVTLSLGERTYESYKKLYDVGADRYLLRHETADEEHYSSLHPQNLTLESRMNCLRALKEIGFQVGCGFMVGSPHQTTRTLAKDLKFIEEFSPHMCGIGPFIPHRDTPFKNMPSGDVQLTLYLLSVIRLISPGILLPSTTALGTLQNNGRELGILAGANVVMPNLSPYSVRAKYQLYNNKLSDGAEAAECKKELEKRMKSIGYRVVTHRGDCIIK